MTQDEHDLLADLANKIAQTPAPARDPEAEDFIRKNIGTRPDALYLMTQTVLIQNMALQQSQHQIQELQQRLSQPAPTGGGSFLGRSTPPPLSSYGSSAYSAPPQQQYGQNPQYQAAPPQPQYSMPPVAPPPSGMSGFLRGAAQTAAGVAAGTIAVQGIESLFSHHSGFGAGGLMGGGGIGGYGGGETVIENNYYDGPQGAAGQPQHFSDAASALGPQDDDLQDANAQDLDTNYDDGTDVDDSNYDDSGDNSGDDSNFA
jgi:hypothetical protein